MEDRNTTIRHIAIAGMLLAIVILMVWAKNISGYIAGPAINAAIVIAALEVNLWCGIGFAVATPIISLFWNQASPTSVMGFNTYGLITIIIIIGNIIYLLAAYFFRKKKIYWFIVALIMGVVLKWGFMWASASLVSLGFGLQTKVITQVFAIMQLVTGLISVPVVAAVKLALDKIYHRD